MRGWGSSTERMPQGAVQRRVRECKAAVQQLLWQDSLAHENDVLRHVTQDRSRRRLRNPHANAFTMYFGKVTCEIMPCRRFGRDEVYRTREFRASDDVINGVDGVVEPDPAQVPIPGRNESAEGTGAAVPLVQGLRGYRYAGFEASCGQRGTGDIK